MKPYTELEIKWEEERPWETTASWDYGGGYSWSERRNSFRQAKALYTPQWSDSEDEVTDEPEDEGGPEDKENRQQEDDGEVAADVEEGQIT